MNNKERPLAGPGTVIGSNVLLTGVLKDSGDITIHGKVEGELTSERSIIIGETAEIKGPVSGQIVTIAGFVKGSIDAGQKLEILPTGKVYGSISTRELIIRGGALFVGKSTMPVEEESQAATEQNEMTDAEMAEYETVGHAAIDEE